MSWLDPRIWLVVLVALFVGAGAGHVSGYRAASKAALVEQQETALAAMRAARLEEQRRVAAQQEIAENAERERDQARVDARAAAAASDELRKRIALLVAGEHSRASAGSSTAGDPIGVLADVLGRADGRAGELAEYADAARIAGEQCERNYDALTTARD